MVFLGIIWGPAYKYKKEVLADAEQSSQLLLSFDLNLGDSYKQFVYDMYEYEDMPKWKIDKKLEHMNYRDNSTISVLFCDVDTQNQSYHPFKHCFVYSNVENMKMYIREKYKNKVDNYFFDTVFHLTDNREELNHSVQVLISYLQKNNYDNELFNSLKNLIVFLKNRDVPCISSN